MGAVRVFIFVFLMAWICVEAGGQVTGRGGPLSESSTLELLRERMAQSASSTGGVPQEGPVDPDTYQAGPGDVFQVGLGGLQAASISLTVTADGYLILPDAGTVQVSGLSLAQAREKVVQQLKPAYRNVMITVALAQPRQFYVHVVGAVTAPGRYVVMPVGRVLDAVSLAFADTTRPATSNLRYRPSFRSISVTGVTGDVRSADLVRYLVTGDTRFNPYLRDGDVVHVGAHNPVTESVFVNGDVPFAGTFEYRVGDTVADLLALATGKPHEADRYRLIRVTRKNQSGSLETVPGTTDVPSGNFGSVELRALDQVFFQRYGDEERGVVMLQGAVRFPGSYPIEKGKTTLHDILKVAGGFGPNALRRAAYLERRAAPSMIEVPARFVGFNLGPNVPSLFLPDTSAVIQRIRLAPMDWRGTNYFMRELRSERRLALDLENATPEQMAEISLQDGDRLVVPTDDKAIFVFGQVKRAGFVAYEPDQTVGYYLGRADGKTEVASDVYLIEAGSGTYLKGEGSVVRPGDFVFVDSREYLADSAELSRLAVEEKRIEADAKFRTTQIVLQTISSVASIIALIITVSR